MLTRGQTYYISNGLVKVYDTRLRSAHESRSVHASLEITLNNPMIIKEARNKLRFDPIPCHLVEFEHAKKQPVTFEVVDMLGTLGSVHLLIIFTHRKKNTPVPKMLITIRNSRLKEVTLALTSDLATSECVKLHEIWPSEVTVLVTNLLVSQYQGNVTFSATAASAVLHADRMLPQSADCQLRKHRRPWYNSCFKCKKGVFASGCELSCPKCNNTIYESRYSLRITVSDGTSEPTVNLFDTAKAFTRYPIKQYQAMPTKKTKILLIERIGKMYSFYFNMARITPSNQARGRIFAKAFEENAPV